jgi:septum site-determining protein MinD
MLAIAGGKGGVGKTTTALGLGRVLAQSGLDPIVVDADVDMPDLGLLAGVDREPSTDRLADGAPIERAVQPSPDVSSLGVVTAGRPETLPAALRRLEGWHGPVLVDCPAGASRDVARPLRCCDRTVLVTTHTPEALEDTAKTAAVATELEAPPTVVAVRGDTNGYKPVSDLDPPRGRICSRSYSRQCEEGHRAEAWFDCPVVRVPTVGSGSVSAHPRFRGACQRLAEISSGEDARIFNRG